MKSLKEALVDYDLVLLQGLADKRGLVAPPNRSADSVADFSEALLSPVSIVITVADLSMAEKEALNYLISAGNVLEARKFVRLYGDIRPIGPNRLEREKPWLSPTTISEGLWYRGLIFKSFQHTINGPEEVIFIPNDLQASLPITPIKTPPFQISLSSTPAVILPSSQAAREDLFTLLVYLRANAVTLTADGEIPRQHRQEILAQFSHIDADDPDAKPAQRWLAFIHHLAHRLNFLERQGQRLKLNPQVVRSWLQKSAWVQQRQLQDTWRSDPTWNDLWHVPGLYPKKTGWENSPLLGRSRGSFMRLRIRRRSTHYKLRVLRRGCRGIAAAPHRSGGKRPSVQATRSAQRLRSGPP